MEGWGLVMEGSVDVEVMDVNYFVCFFIDFSFFFLLILVIMLGFVDRICGELFGKLSRCGLL